MLVVGSANLDLVFRSDRLPIPGETILGRGFETYPGGKGANQAVAVGRLGGEVAFSGCLGSDAFGDELRAHLQAAGVRVDFVARVPVPSGTAGILVGAAGMNMIVVAPGANALVTEAQVAKALAECNPSVTLCQLEIPMNAVREASRATRFVLNPAPAAAVPDEILKRCYVLTPNESELQSLTGIEPVDLESCGRAARMLLDRGVQNVVVTLGARGSYWESAQGGCHFPAPPVNAIDTTAAGDAFNGALAMFLAEGRPLEDAIPLANCVGALSATKPGAQSSMPTREELLAFAGHLV